MKYSTRLIIRDYATTIIVAIGVALAIRTFFIEAYRIPSQSMKPALLAGDTIFVKKWPFSFGAPLPKRGSVVVFSGAASGGASLDYIKRVVGLPGDEITLTHGRIILNGTPLGAGTHETLPEGFSYPVTLEEPYPEDLAPTRIPEGNVFVIGDLRSLAETKKRASWGMVPRSSLKGIAAWIWLSIDPQAHSPWIPSFRFDRMFRRIL